MNIDLATLRYFQHVAAAQSFVGGARRAHVSPPAMSKAIRRLEETLGVRLFERTTRRVVLTPAGRELLGRCARITAELEGLGNDLAEADGLPRGPLRIGAMEVFSIELLPAALAALLAEHPKVVPHCHEMIPQRIADLLASGELDVGFTIGATATRGIERRTLGTSQGVLVCGKRHPLYRGGRVRASDLREHPSVVPRFLGAERLPSLDQFPDERFPRMVGATIELLQMGVELVARGTLLGYFPRISVAGHLASGRLRALAGLRTSHAFELSAIVLAGVPVRPGALALIERVRQEIAADARRR